MNGFPIQEAFCEFEKIQAIPEADFENYVNGKKAQIVDYHLKNNNSYQKRVAKSSFNLWNELPVLTKKDFQ
ncbi:MAG: hypothetical protein NT127_06025, partial [Sphingobacteriales bacterium]|nr:hypothetical protein [Sphingobacteriales bacterium]